MEIVGYAKQLHLGIFAVSWVSTFLNWVNFVDLMSQHNKTSIDRNLYVYYLI